MKTQKRARPPHHTTPDSWNELLELAKGGQDALLRAGVRARFAELLARPPRPGAREPYGRRLLHSSDSGEVMLAGWPRHARSAPHDHGDAAGSVLVLDGVFVETSFDFDGSELRAGPRRRFAAFDLLRASPGIVHDMQAREEGLTLHFYWPAIRAMRVFDIERRATFVVTGEGGAWIPQRLGRTGGHVSWDDARHAL